MNTEELQIIRDLISVAERASQTFLNSEVIDAARALVEKYEAKK